MKKVFQWLWNRLEGFTNCVKREEFDKHQEHCVTRAEFDTRHADGLNRIEAIAQRLTETVDNNTAMILSNQNKMDQKIDRNQENTFSMIMTMKKG